MKKSGLFLVSRSIFLLAAILIAVLFSTTVFASQGDHDALCVPGGQCLVLENEDSDSDFYERVACDVFNTGIYPEILGTALPSDYLLQREFGQPISRLIDISSHLNRAPPL